MRPIKPLRVTWRDKSGVNNRVLLWFYRVEGHSVWLPHYYSKYIE
jgi:hypothetical protein